MIKKCLLTLVIIIFATQIGFAKNISTEDDFAKLTINLLDPSMKVTQLAINFNITISQIEAFNEFIKATDKFK